MENGNNPAKKMAKEVIIELYWIDNNKQKSESFRSDRRLHENKDAFVDKITNKLLTYPPSYSLTSPVFNKKTNVLNKKTYYNNVEKSLNSFFNRCDPNYITDLIKDWNKAKKKDTEKWFKVIGKPNSQHYQNKLILRLHIDNYEIFEKRYSLGYRKDKWGHEYKIENNN